MRLSVDACWHAHVHYLASLRPPTCQRRTLPYDARSPLARRQILLHYLVVHLIEGSPVDQPNDNEQPPLFDINEINPIRRLAELTVSTIQNEISDPFQVKLTLQCGDMPLSTNGHHFRLSCRMLILEYTCRGSKLGNSDKFEEILQDEHISGYTVQENKEKSHQGSTVSGKASARGSIGVIPLIGGSAHGTVDGLTGKSVEHAYNNHSKVRPRIYRVQAIAGGWQIGGSHGDLVNSDRILRGSYFSDRAGSPLADFRWQRNSTECRVAFSLLLPISEKYLVIELEQHKAYSGWNWTERVRNLVARAPIPLRETAVQELRRRVAAIAVSKQTLQINSADASATIAPSRPSNDEAEVEIAFAQILGQRRLEPAKVLLPAPSKATPYKRKKDAARGAKYNRKHSPASSRSK